jgi:hypothetical protein
VTAPAPVPPCGADAAAEAEEGASYGRALLERIAAGAAGADDLAAVLGFMHSGSMLHGCCAVLYHALRQVLARGGAQ